MEGGTDALAAAGEAVEPLELEPIELYDEFDVAVDPRHAGPDAGRRRALRARRRASSACRVGRAARAPASRCASAACCAASPRSSSTAAPASPPTAWASGRCPRSEILEIGPRMAAFRGISHCYQRPTYADWPYSVFTMAHGRSKEECDAILDAIAARHRDRGARDALLAHRVQEDPAALLHRRLQALGAGARAAEPTSLTDTRSAELYARALQRAARRRELARARDARDRPRPDLHRARRGRRDHRRRRQPLRRLRLLVGPADPRPRAPDGRRGGHRGRRARARASARRPRARSSWPSEVVAARAVASRCCA